MLPSTVNRVVCSCLELRQALLLSVMSSHMIALALGSGRISKGKKGSFCGLDLLERPPWSMLLLEAVLACVTCVTVRPVDVSGPCCHWGHPLSVLLLAVMDKEVSLQYFQ